MPSFRTTITVGALAPGVPPQTVLPTAADAASELTTLESSSVSIVRGAAQITVRFTAEDAELAEQIAAHILEVTSTVAEPVSWTLTQRSRDRWATIRRG